MANDNQECGGWAGDKMNETCNETCQWQAMKVQICSKY